MYNIIGGKHIVNSNLSALTIILRDLEKGINQPSVVAILEMVSDKGEISFKKIDLTFYYSGKEQTFVLSKVDQDTSVLSAIETNKINSTFSAKIEDVDLHTISKIIKDNFCLTININMTLQENLFKFLNSASDEAKEKTTFDEFVKIVWLPIYNTDLFSQTTCVIPKQNKASLFCSSATKKNQNDEPTSPAPSCGIL